jgi:hypothetical protein
MARPTPRNVPPEDLHQLGADLCGTALILREIAQATGLDGLRLEALALEAYGLRLQAAFPAGPGPGPSGAFGPS